MFSSLGLLEDIPCPEGDQCQLLVCFFSHNLLKSKEIALAIPDATRISELDGSYDDGQRPRKKQKLGSEQPSKIHSAAVKKTSFQASFEAVKSKTPRTEDKDREQGASDPNFSQSLKPDNSLILLNSKTDELAAKDGLLNSKAPPFATLVKKPSKSEKKKKEHLNPRVIPKPPVAHAVRFKLLKLIHEQMLRLNNEVEKSTDPFKEVLILTSDELVTAALDEEEATAKSKASIYLNVMKLRVGALKKLKFDGWKEERISQIRRSNSELLPDYKQPKVARNEAIDTKLTADAEVALLPKLVTSQKGLDQHGYVLSAPSNDDVEECSKAIEAAKNWEVCDRCQTRFQIFPGRRESDGAVASGGSCAHHWGKTRRPAMEKGQRVKPQYYTCCRQEIGTPGCSTTSTHVRHPKLSSELLLMFQKVFKISDPKRLAFVLPFEKTPLVKDRARKQPVCFDCEMGYTTYGMELIRLTAVSWPNGIPLLDILVRPLGEILDLNSRFSGVHPESYTTAKSWTSTDELPPPPPSQKDLAKPIAETSLYIVPSPAHARSLLFNLLDPDTPLIGHALENDLNAARIIHPTIIDTVLLYPHPSKLPSRCGLKMLAKTELDWDIQMGGEMGHDSMEDARAAGELVRLAVKKEWIKMQKDGWRVEGDVFHAP